MFEISERTRNLIVIPDRATEMELYCAEELQKYLNLVFDFLFPIQKVKDAEKCQNRIFVGKHDSSCGFFKEIYEDLRQDGFCIITFQSDLYIFGNDNVFSRSATLYGIYEFLEKYIGVKFYSYDEEYFPKKKRFRTSGIDVRVNPDFEIRQPLYASTRLHPEFTAKMRIKDCYCPNVPGGSLSSMWGTGLGHNFFSLIPPAKYKDEHPEWFDLEPEHRQLCFSQPSLNAELVAVLKQKIAEKRDAEYFALSQEDTTTPCQCEKCRRSYEKYGVSGTMIRFVNSVAEEIEKWRKIACPNRKVYLVTFAYLFSIKPPVVKIKGGGFKPIDGSCVPKENVYVFFTTIDFCFYHGLLDKKCEWNKDFKDEFDGWHYLVGKRMFVWNYGINYKHYMYPFWNFDSIASNYRYFKKNGVKHLLEHGQCESEFVEMAELRTYVSSKLMWNTRLSVKKLIREFVNAYYKVASEEVMKYLDLLEKNFKRADEKYGYHLRLYHLPESMFDDKIFDYGFLQRLIQTVDEALKKVEDAYVGEELEMMKKRVLRIRVSAKYLLLMNYQKYTDKGLKEFIEGFERDCRIADITKYKEWGNDNIRELCDLALEGKVLDY